MLVSVEFLYIITIECIAMISFYVTTGTRSLPIAYLFSEDVDPRFEGNGCDDGQKKQEEWMEMEERHAVEIGRKRWKEGKRDVEMT